MSYSDLYIHRGQRVPTILTAAVIGIFIFVLTVFTNLKPQPSKASPNILKSVTPVNVSHNQVGIYWETTVQESGWILYGESDNNTTKLAYDVRDVEENKSKYTHHFVTLKDLKPGTKYYYKIVSNNKMILNDNKSFDVTTLISDADTNETKLAYGKVVKSNGTPSENNLVLVKINDAYPFMTVTKLTGEWLVPIQRLIQKGSNQEEKLKETDKITVNIYSDTNESTRITTDASNISPLPQTTILGKDYNFADNTKVLSANTSVSTDATIHTEILFPKDRAIISSGKPLLKGTAVPFSDVDITLQPVNSSLNYAFRASADKDGYWRVNLDRTLPLGSYIITVIGHAKNGETERKTHNFSIANVGAQILGEGTVPTPSATVAPTAGASTPIPTTIPTTIQNTPTTINSPTVFVTATPSPPVTGVSIVPVAVFSMALVVIGAGILLAF